MYSLRTGFIMLTGLLAWGTISSQEVHLTGSNPEYAGKEVRIVVPEIPFLDIPFLDTLARFDDKGNLNASISMPRSTQVILETGIYEATLFAEPGKQYEVEFPPLRELTYPERISPFFNPLRIPLKTLQPSGDINGTIFRFDSLFHIVNNQVILYRNRKEVPPVDSLIGILRQEFSEQKVPWFSDYMRYKFGILALNAGREGLGSISRTYLGRSVRDEHPAYLELFRAMFRDFLDYYSRTNKGSGIRYCINRSHDLDSLRKIVRGHEAVTSDTLCDLLLFLELPKLFYRGDYHKQAILILLDSLEANPAKPVYVLYAARIRDRLSSLMTGNHPPGFYLTGTDGNKYSPESYLGKYTYLMFCTPEHYGCMIEYPFLNEYYLKHSDYLNVVTIMVAEDREEVADFMERNHYPWTALFWDDQQDLLENYLVRAFPVAFLIGPDGKLILSPAPLPSDGFEQQLFRIMRAKGEI